MKILPSMLATALVAAVATAQQTLIIPRSVDEHTDGRSAVEHPFGHDGYSTGTDSSRVLYVYANSHFEGIHTPIEIYRLRVRANTAPTYTTGAGGAWTQVEVRMGEAEVPWDGPSTTYALNYPGGVEPVPAFAGSVTVQPWSGNHDTAPGDWFVDIVLTNPVAFDPRTGKDFIVDISNEGTFTGLVSDLTRCDEDFVNGRTKARVVRNQNHWRDPMGSLVTQEHGLVCELTYGYTTGVQAGFSMDTKTPGPGQTITFTDRSRTSHPGGVLATMWDFDNDGTPDANGPTATWTFQSCRPYTISMTVVDALGSSSYTFANAIDIGLPTADFEAVWAGASPVTVSFTDTSDGHPYAWEWDFDGDNVVDSTLQNPSWTFPTRDIREVELVVTNGCGQGDPVSKTLDMREAVCAGFPWDSYQGRTNWSHFFDANVSNAAGLTITEIGAHSNQSFGTFTQIQVWTRSGSYVGFDNNRSQWQQRAVVNATSSGNQYRAETVYDVPDFHLSPGVHGFAIVYTAGGPTFPAGQLTEDTVGNLDLQLSFGVQRTNQFAGDRLERRGWSGCVYYCVGDGRGTVTQLGTGCPNSTGGTATLVSQGGTAPAIGQPFTLELGSAPPNNVFSFVSIGVANLGGIDLGIIGAPGCLLYPEPLVSLTAQTDAMGNATATFGISPNRDTVGFKLYAQGIMADVGTNPLGAVVSDALEATVGCRQ